MLEAGVFFRDGVDQFHAGRAAGGDRPEPAPGVAQLVEGDPEVAGHADHEADTLAALGPELLVDIDGQFFEDRLVLAVNNDGQVGRDLVHDARGQV